MNKILITGGCGFIGSNLVDFFLKKRNKVIVLDKKGKRFSNDWLKKNNHRDLKIFYDDIRNKNKVFELVKKVDYVIHLAALISIPHSYKYPDEHLTTNIIGTFNILEAVKKYKKKSIITSTSETYGSGVSFPMTENHRLFAQSPYAATKISADQLALSYYNSYNTKIKIIRPFNCFGPRQSPRAVIPNMILQMLGKKNKIKIGNVNTFRDYTFVEDLCNAYWNLYKSKKGYGQIFNVGSGKTYKISHIYKILKKIIKYNGSLTVELKRLRPNKSEVIKLHAANYKFKKIFNWKPNTRLEKGLLETVEWFNLNRKFFKKTINKYAI
jgi:nucleoside-diphosphate-sugar epimerase